MEEEIFICKPVASTDKPNLGWIVFGISSLIVGTLVSISLVPEDPYTPGVLRESGIAMTLAFVVGPCLMASRNIKNAFRAESILLFAPIYWILLDLLQGYYPMNFVNQDDVCYTLVAIGLFGVGCFLGFVGQPWPMPGFIKEAIQVEYSSNAIINLAWVAFVIAMLGYAIPSSFDLPAMIEAIGSSRFSAPWTRGALGGWDAIYDHLSYFGMVLPALAVLYGRKKEGTSFHGVTVILMLAAVFLLFVAQGGNRRYIGVSIGSGLLCYILSARRLGWLQILVLLASAGFLLVLMQIVYLYRGEGLAGLLKNESVREVNYLHVDDNFLRLAQTIHFVPNETPYVYHRWIVYVAVRPIPRLIWQGKPTSRGIYELNEMVGIAGVGLSMSAIGELYLSWGFLAVLIGGWLYGRISTLVNQILYESDAPERYIVYGGAGMAIFAGVRSMIDLVLMSYVVLAWVGLCIIYRMAKRMPGT